MDLGTQIYTILEHSTIEWIEWNTLGEQQVPSYGKYNQNHKLIEGSRTAASSMCQ